jgi:hypothetical protein
MSYDPEPVLVDDTKADMITTPHRETHAARNVKNKKPQPHWLARMIHIVIRWVKHFWHHHHHRCVWDEVRWFFYVYFSSSFYSTYVSLSRIHAAAVVVQVETLRLDPLPRTHRGGKKSQEEFRCGLSGWIPF